MIDIEKSNTTFEKYVSNYDDTIEKIKLKKSILKEYNSMQEKLQKV